MQSGRASRHETTIVLRFLGEERKLFLLAAGNGDFYVIFPGNEIHASYHDSGQRRFSDKRKVKWPENYTPHRADGFPADVDISKRPPQHRYISQRQPTATLRGSELILGTTINMHLGTFRNLSPHQPSERREVTLDADAAHFRDDVIFLRVFLVEPGLQPEIPAAANVGPAVVYLIKHLTPWLGIACFQEKSSFKEDSLLEYRQVKVGNL